MKFFDTHAHLNDDSFSNHPVFENAASVGVDQMVAIGIDLKSSYQCLKIADENQGVFASVGIHPNGCHRSNELHWKEIEQLLTNPNVVALGETGLDCHWDDTPMETQKHWFAKHIRLSHETGYPIVVHLRESESQILDSFRELNDDGKIHGIMHSFTGSFETAKECLDYGMYISFAGMVTFKNAQSIRDVAKEIPDDRILIETDSPYLTPHPHRGQRPNEPSMVVHTAQCLAEIRGTDLATVAKLTTENAERVFGIES